MSARERADSSRREVEEREGRVESLSHKVAVLKQALQQASTASSLNASLQHEVARLTEDNLVGVSNSFLLLAFTCTCMYVHTLTHTHLHTRTQLYFCLQTKIAT